MWVVIDFETASAVDLKKSGAWRYAEDPTTEVLGLSYETNSGYRGDWEPGSGDRFLQGLADNPDCTFIAHNVQFEKAIWRHIMVPEFGFPDIPNRRWHDTLAVCAHRALPLELEHVLQVLGIATQKDMEGRKITLGMSKANKAGYYDRSDSKRSRSALYRAQDVAAEVALHKTIGWLPPSERNVWLLNQRVNERGLRLDLEFVRAAQKIVDDASGPLLAEFAAITGGLKPSQRAKFLAWLESNGTTLPNLTKETVAAAIGSDEDEDNREFSCDVPHNIYNRALRIRQLVGSASIKKLKRMELCVSADGRARGLSQYHGTTPGRAAGRLLQPYNFPRGTLKIDYGDGKVKSPPPQLVVDAIMTGDYSYVEQTIGPAVETVVSSLRHALVPDPGRMFISGDYAGIQARVTLALAGQHDKTALMAQYDGNPEIAKTRNVYCDMGEQIFHYPINKGMLREYTIGKNTVLGLGFQMGADKFHEKYCPKEPIEFAENVVRVYRKEWAPKVPYLWYGLSDAAVKTVHARTPHDAYGIEYRLEEGALTARLPSGRKIWYQHPKATTELMPWLDDGEKVWKPGFRYWAMKTGHWQEIKAFGGLLTENVVMGIEVDIQRHAQFLCEKNGFPVVLEVYDEIVVEPEVGADEKAFEQILLDVEPWVKELAVPIAVETWQGDRYRK